MRKSTVAIVSFLIAFPIVYILPILIEAYGYNLGPGRSQAISWIASLVIGSVIALVLMPINKRLLAWRKTRGRDIEEEERYETGGGMIRLTPNPEDKSVD